MVKLIFLLLLSPILLFLSYFLYDSVRESEKCAAFLAAFVLMLLLISAGTIVLFISSGLLLWSLNVLVAFFYIMLMVPWSKPSSLRISDTILPYDERDIMFARARYRPGTPEYDDYYKRHPDKQKGDDALRGLPDLLEPGGLFYERSQALLAQTFFEKTEALIPQTDGQQAESQIKVDAETATVQLKQKARELGAIDVGVAKLHPGFLYTHVGRGPGGYGSPIKLDHKWVIVFAVEMDAETMRLAPNMPVVVESSRQYLNAANIGVALAVYIRNLGYPARAHTDANYRLMVPAAAHAAGLGEVGRIGYLIHPRYGARIRLGAVTTNLPLLPDPATSIGAQDFCRICKKCAQACPAAAISHGSEKSVRGVHKWSTNQEACYALWRRFGTDCGICMHVCPYSRPATVSHNVIRRVIQRNAIMRCLAVWADKVLYPITLSGF